MSSERESQIASRFRQTRIEHYSSQAGTAIAIGLTRDKVANIESGRAVLRTGVAARFCQYFNISQRWLATGLEPRFPFVRLAGELPCPAGFAPDGTFSQMYDNVLAPHCEAFYRIDGPAILRQLKRIAYARPVDQRGAGTPETEGAVLRRAVDDLLDYLTAVLPPSLFAWLFDTFRTAAADFVQASGPRLEHDNKAAGRDTAATARAIESAPAKPRLPAVAADPFRGATCAKSSSLLDSDVAPLRAHNPDAYAAATAAEGTIEKDSLTGYPVSETVPPVKTAIESWPALRDLLNAMTEERGKKVLLARWCGLTPQAISDWLRGVYSPEADTALKLLRAVESGELAKVLSIPASEGTSPASAPKSTPKKPAKKPRKTK